MIRAVVALGLGLSLPVRAEAARPGWLCVGSEEFLHAAAPLIKHRRAQGLEVTLATGTVEEAIAGCPRPPAFILLLGDEVRGSSPPGSAKWRVRAARIPYHGWLDSHPGEFVSDMARGDFDDDGLPDASTGRIPARTAADVAAAAEKILRWEKRTASLADLTLPVWAGDPGFGALFKDMALGFLFAQTGQRAPLWAELWVMQSDERSPFCGWPADQQSLYNSRLQRGGLLSAMIGHGRPGGWWSMDIKAGRLEYTVEDAALLKRGTVSPPHIIFACSCGNFALRESRCLAEALFRAPGGPVLCVAASEDSHPLTNYYHSTALLECLSNAEPRFGDLWLRSLRKAHTTTEPDKELLVRALEPLMIHKVLNTDDIRADHAFLYNIMGDPATRMFAPQQLEAEITERDGRWHWRVPQPPAGARLFVQHRDSSPAFGLSKAAGSRAEAGRCLREANTTLQFKTVEEFKSGAPWEGTAAGPGTLRLVSISSKGLAVAAVAMKPPEVAPAETSAAKREPEQGRRENSEAQGN